MERKQISTEIAVAESMFSNPKFESNEVEISHYRVKYRVIKVEGLNIETLIRKGGLANVKRSVNLWIEANRHKVSFAIIKGETNHELTEDEKGLLATYIHALQWLLVATD